jgi:AcrR family transcriptional regulator
MPSDEAGRINQKRRTRDALIAAARTLVARGVSPTVEQAAAAAGVSRTTAYRYFPNQHGLLAAAHPETGAVSLLPDDASDDPRARLDAVVDAYMRMIADTEAQQRTMLRLSLEATPDERRALPLRQGRAIRWIDEALNPLRGQVPDKDVRRLVLAVRATTGIEALVWLTDIAGLSRDEAAALMRWSARALFDQTVAESKRPGRASPQRPRRRRVAGKR